MSRILLPLSALVLILTSCQQQKPKEETSPKPNILIIVADDMGYSDIGCFGGNIQTPVIDQLGKEGMLFSDFHVQPTCSPSRSSLLTGNDNHVTGFGIMHEGTYPALEALQLPGYSGHLSDQVATIPELLRGNGYHTYMTGKWHLGEGAGHDPHDRGFEETFILGTGGGSHFNDLKPLAPPQQMDYTRNGKSITLAQSFYSTKDYTDSMIHFIDMNKSDHKPFFGYLSYTAVHDPLQAPKEYIDKYKGRFDMGWDSLYTLRLKNLEALGIVPKDLKQFAKNPAVPEWSSLDKEHQQELARDMEVYAAMIDYMDMSIGRVIDYLKKNSMYDNTMIIFMSDNGGNGQLASFYPGNEDGKYLSSFDNSIENRGLQNSFVEPGPGWTQASSAPFRLFKSFSTEGGIRVPLIIKLPGENENAGNWNQSFAHVTDIMPTILQIAGVNYPTDFNGKKIHPLIGNSLMPILDGDSVSVHSNDGMGWELFEMKAYIKANWKILRLPKPFGSGDWQLYDLSKDPGETTDLSAQFPDLRTQLINDWNHYAMENDVYDHHGHYDSIYVKSMAPEKNDD